MWLRLCLSSQACQLLAAGGSLSNAHAATGLEGVQQLLDCALQCEDVKHGHGHGHGHVDMDMDLHSHQDMDMGTSRKQLIRFCTLRDAMI